MIKITETAQKYLQQIAKSNSKQYVWFGVDGGGCSGFTYKWDFVDSPENNMTIDVGDNISLVLDQISEMYVMGSEIDYVQELGGSYLKVNNPLASSSCGCGESFSVKS